MDDISQRERLYTLSQAVVATFLGGPLAGALLLAQNYKRLDMPQHARRAVIYGFLSVVALFAITLVLPERIPNIVLPVAYTLAFRAMAEHLQGPQVRSRMEAGAERYSWWRTIGVSLAGVLYTAVFFIGGLLILGVRLPR